MITVRKSDERGHANHGWLDTYHTFSFDTYLDPNHMGFRTLRVINEDRVAPGAGFPTHGHRDMEILTYIVAGALEHKDSMGYGEVLRPGEIQRMSAGTGIRHSEFNPSADDPVHLLQIWILPAQRGTEPGYEQIAIGDGPTNGRLQLIASPERGAVHIGQDAKLYRGKLDAGAQVEHALDASRHAYVQVVRGAVDASGNALSAGDGASVSGESSLRFATKDGAEFLVFDLA